MSTAEESILIQTAMGRGGIHDFLQVFEANYDPDSVSVIRSEAAIRSLLLNFIIEATTQYAFQELILKPLLQPIATRFDVMKAAQKYLLDNQPFTLVVKIKSGKLGKIDGDLKGRDHIASVWKNVDTTLAILRDNKLDNVVTRVRLNTDEKGVLLVIAYVEAKPAYLIDIAKRKATPYQ